MIILAAQLYQLTAVLRDIPFNNYKNSLICACIHTYDSYVKVENYEQHKSAWFTQTLSIANKTNIWIASWLVPIYG